MAPSDGGGGLTVILVQVALIFLIFYWLLIRPQKKEQERHQEMIHGLQKGDEIITSGGIVGTIVHLTEDRLTIRSDEKTRLVIDRSRVARKADEDADGRGA